MSARLVLIMLVAALAGCSAKLHVTVNVANSETVRYAAVQQAQGVECLALHAKSDRGMEADLDRRLAVLEKAMGEFQALMREYAASLAGNQKTIQLDMADNLPATRATLAEQTEHADVVEKSRNLRMQLRKLHAGRTCDVTDPRVIDIVATHRRLMHEYDLKLQGEITDVRSAMETRRKQLIAETPQVAETPIASAAATRKEDQVVRTAAADRRAACTILICDGGLGSSNFAHAVASMPESEWQALFNRASAGGTNGNLDIVVKMNERADFTVKGMRFDVSRIPEMARKATTQGLLLAAQLSGVPIHSAPQAQADNVGLAPASVELSEVLAKQTQRETMLAHRRMALIRLGILVASSGGDLTTDTGRAQLAAALQAQATALDPLIRLTDYNQ